MSAFEGKNQITTSEQLREGLVAIASSHGRLAKCIEELDLHQIAIPLRNQPAGFRGLCAIIISQLVSRESAAAIQARFDAHFPDPDPQSCLKAPDTVWIEIGLSRPKQKAICNVARAIETGRLDFSILHAMPPDDAIANLTAIKGIGPWSAEVYVLFCMAHRDIFPAGDLALRKAVGDILAMTNMPSEKEVRIIAKQWAPWRGIAARICWSWAGYMKSRPSLKRPTPDNHTKSQ